ncbi:MAG: hypothetical protein AAGE94_16000 [Acidobacteriota bacterium]
MQRTLLQRLPVLLALLVLSASAFADEPDAPRPLAADPLTADTVALAVEAPTVEARTLSPRMLSALDLPMALIGYETPAGAQPGRGDEVPIQEVGSCFYCCIDDCHAEYLTCSAQCLNGPPSCEMACILAYQSCEEQCFPYW